MNKIKKIMIITLCVVMAIINSSLAFAEDANLISAKAKDYNGHWAQATIQKWIDEGRISGYPDGSFKPEANITRAEFVKMVNSIIDYDVQGTITYADVKSGDWYYTSISIAQEIGYISGYSKNQFGPNDNITREQAATILARAEYLGENKEAAQKFSDKNNMSSWAVNSIGAASEAGYINGYENGSFKPLNKLTRAEAVTMLDNVLVNSKNYIIYKAGTELKNFVVDGNLVIAKTVGEGDVHLDNVTVTGKMMVYGGGMNSIYFNKVKVAKIEVEKNKVRLVLGDGTVVEEIAVGSEAKLENKNGEIGKITIDSEGKVTLSGSFNDVKVVSSADIILDNAKIQNLVVDKAVKILGTGTINTLTANADGITYESTAKITKTVLGSGVTKKPEVIVDNGGTVGGGGSVTDPSYAVSVTAELTDGPLTSNLTFTTKAYSSTDKISDFLVSELKSILTEGSKNASIESYFDKLIPRLKKLEIGATPVYTPNGFDKAIAHLNGTSVYDGLSALKATLLDEDISVADINAVLALYNPANVAGDSTKIKLNLASYPFDTQTVSYNGNVITAPYTITYKTTTLTTNKQVADMILNNIAFSTMTVEQFFTDFGTEITITSTVGSKTATLKIKRVELK